MLSFLQLDVYDVFLLDSEFHIERPTRALRQGLRAMHLEDRGSEDGDSDKGGLLVRALTGPFHRHDRHVPPDPKEGENVEGVDHGEHTEHEDDEEGHRTRTEPNQGNLPMKKDDSLRDSHRKHTTDPNEKELPPTPRSRSSHPRRSSVSTARSTILGRLRSIGSGREGSQRRSSSSDSVSSHNSDSSAESDMAEPAYHDPSTHVNTMINKHGQGDIEDADRNKKKKDLSHHTFFIENSQMRLKLVARTEVSVSSNCLNQF